MKYPTTTLVSTLMVSTSIILAFIIFNNNFVYADSFQGSDKADITIGSQKDDNFDSGKGNDASFGDAVVRDGNGKDVIISEGGDDTLSGGKGKDIFICGSGLDTVKDFSPTEGDIQVACENH